MAAFPVQLSGSMGQTNFSIAASGGVAENATGGPGGAAYTAFLAAYDAVGAAIIAISGDAYSATTHQFTNSGSTALTSAQLHTQTTALNAAITLFLGAGTPWIQFLSQYDAVGAAIIAISGDTYSSTTHQFTNGGATGLTSAQLHTQLTALNTAITSFLLSQTYVNNNSMPVADVNVTIGAGSTPVSALSRYQVIKILQGMINYLGSDGNLASPVIPFGSV